MKQRLLNILIALDQLLYALVTLGYGSPLETLSAAAYRMELNNKRGRIFRPVIDWVFSPLQKDHCRKAFENLQTLKHLPTAYKLERDE